MIALFQSNALHPINDLVDTKERQDTGFVVEDITTEQLSKMLQ